MLVYNCGTSAIGYMLLFGNVMHDAVQTKFRSTFSFDIRNEAVKAEMKSANLYANVLLL